MKKTIYYRHGNKYYKLGRNEVIRSDAMQSWCHGELQPITNSDGLTIGCTPSEFSDERDFYNPVVHEPDVLDKEALDPKWFDEYYEGFESERCLKAQYY